MNGDRTNLEVSRRLAVVWPFAQSPISRWFWAVSPEGEEYLRNGVAGQRPDGVWHDIADGCLVYPARDLSELEAKMEEMWFACTIVFGVTHPANAMAAIRKGFIQQGAAHADTIIDALGAAVAEALEKAGEGGQG